MRFAEIAFDAWGYRTVETYPSEIVGRLVKEVQEGISNYDIVSIEFEDSTNRDGFRRAYADLPVSPELFDLFFNGRSEYRAQYFAGQEIASHTIPSLLQQSHRWLSTMTNSTQALIANYVRNP